MYIHIFLVYVYKQIQMAQGHRDKPTDGQTDRQTHRQANIATTYLHTHMGTYIRAYIHTIAHTYIHPPIHPSLRPKSIAQGLTLGVQGSGPRDAQQFNGDLSSVGLCTPPNMQARTLLPQKPTQPTAAKPQTPKP